MNEIDCERLDDYLDGVLDASSRAVFERHAADCETCRCAIAFEDSLRHAALESNAKTILPSQIELGIRDAIRSSQRHRRFAWSFGLAATIAIILGSSFAFRPMASITGPPRVRVTVATQNGSGDSHSDPLETSAAVQLPEGPAGSSMGLERAPAVVRLQATESPSQVVVPVATQTRSVTLVMLYPTISLELLERSDQETDPLQP